METTQSSYLIALTAGYQRQLAHLFPKQFTGVFGLVGKYTKSRFDMFYFDFPLAPRARTKSRGQLWYTCAVVVHGTLYIPGGGVGTCSVGCGPAIVKIAISPSTRRARYST